MTREDKQLLLKDLCARLPYGVVLANGTKVRRIDILTKIVSGTGTDKMIEDTKYFLRPMSSMTEEEHVKLKAVYDNGSNGLFDEYSHIDWLNANHFDYRGLIPMGLALEAPEGMYD